MVLKEAQVKKSQIKICWAPGAFELPLLAKRMIRRFRPRAVLCLGAIIKGDTSHWRVISQACANGCQKVSLEAGIPVAFGVLTCETAEQAYERSGGKINRGAEAARAALKASRALRRM